MRSSLVMTAGSAARSTLVSGKASLARLRWVLFAAALGQAIGRPVSLAELLASDKPVASATSRTVGHRHYRTRVGHSGDGHRTTER